MNLNELVAKARNQGFGVNLGFRVGEPISCAIYGGYGKLGLRKYACKQGATAEEALALCLDEVALPPESELHMVSPLRKQKLDELLGSLDLEL